MSAASKSERHGPAPWRRVPGKDARPGRGPLVAAMAVAGAAVAVVLLMVATAAWEMVRRQPALTDRPGRGGEAAPPVRASKTLRPPALREAREPPPPIPAEGGPGPHFMHYGGKSGRMAEGLTPSPAEPVTQIGAPGRGPEMVIYVPSIRVQSQGTTIFARVRDDAPVRITSAEAGVVLGTLLAPTAFEPMQIDARGDGLHELRYRFVPPAAAPMTGHEPPRIFRYQVVVRGTRAGEPFERRAGGIFFVHDPGARLEPASAAVTAEAQDGARDVRLRVKAQVVRPGTYFAYAELWGGKDGTRAIAFARDRMTGVSPGERTIELRFGGRILRDAGIDGPFIVRNLRLQQVDTHPAHEDDPVAALPATPPWPARDFH